MVIKFANEENNTFIDNTFQIQKTQIEIDLQSLKTCFIILANNSKHLK